jgi:hypothetical protein
MKNCKIIRKMLSGYIDGALTAAEAEAVREHLGECGECREVHDSMNAIIACMNGMERVPPPADFLEKVNARLERGSTAAERLRRIFVPLGFRLPLELAGLAAAVVLIVYVSGFLGREGVEEMSPRPPLEKASEVSADGAGEVPDAGRTGEKGSVRETEAVAEEEKSAGRAEEKVAAPEEKASDMEKKGAGPRGEEVAGSVEKMVVGEEIVVEGEAKRIEIKSSSAGPAGSRKEKPAPAGEDTAATVAAARVAEGKDANESAELFKVEQKSITRSFALSVNPPSDGLDSLLASLEVVGREIGAFAVKIGGRVVPERETAAVKTSIRAAMSDRRTIRPLTVVIPADSLQIFLGEIERLGKTRPIGASVVSQEGDSATVRVELN